MCSFTVFWVGWVQGLGGGVVGLGPGGSENQSVSGVHRKSLRSLSSAHEKWGINKSVAYIFFFSVYRHNKYTQYTLIYYVNNYFILDAINRLTALIYTQIYMI